MKPASDFGVLVEQGWRAVYAELFGEAFVASLAPHHVEAVEWHWDSRLAFLRGERPDYLAYFPIWPRGHMKSTLAEHMVVVDACLSVFFGQPGFCLYLMRNKDKVQLCISNIEALLSGEKVRAYFPSLSQVKRNQVTNQQRKWTAEFLHTEGDYAIRGGTLDSSQAGSRMEETRPTFIVPDDIDGREDSPVISDSRFRMLTTEILPMGQANTLVYFAQNLISRYSCMYRIHSQQARVLTNRKPTQPIKAVNNLVTEVRTVDGVVKDAFVSGESTWHVWDEQRIQDEIEREGLPSFLKECQHEVEQDVEGVVLKYYNDLIHVISYSQFASIFGTRDIPQYWNKYVFNDWARTKTARHANVAGILTVSAQNSKLPGCVFLFHPMSFPANSAPEDIAERLLTAITPTVRVLRTAGEVKVDLLGTGQSRVYTWAELITSTLQKTGLENLIGKTTELIEKSRSLLAKVIPALVAPILQAQHYRAFRGSHEQSKTGALAVYKKVFGLPFHGVNPGGDGGIDKLNLLQKVDYGVDHPFKPGLKGYTNYYHVTDDDRTATPVIINGVEVYPPVPYNDSLTPDELVDGQLCRYQFKNWRFRDPHLTVTGEQEGELLKMNDDFGNGHQMLLHDELLSAAPLGKDQIVELSIPAALQPATINALEDPQQRSNRLVAQGVARQRIQKEIMRPHTRNPLKALEYELGRKKR